MVQSVLFLLLGFLTATLLALMIAPVVWRRAVTLTQRRIEASVPLSLNELRAEKDQVRAEAALAIRRLEIKNKRLNETSAAQKTEISQRLEDIRQLDEENHERARMIDGLEQDIVALKADMSSLEESQSELSAKFADACDQIEVKIAENDHLARLYDEASLVSSNRQIDLVARDTQLEKLSSDMDAVKQRRDESEALVRELSAELKVAERGQQLSDKKVAEFEKKLTKMMATLSDSEDKLDRREKELARLKDRIKQGESADENTRRLLEQSEEERTKLEKQLSRLQEQVRQDEGAVEDIRRQLSESEGERAKLETQLVRLQDGARSSDSADDGLRRQLSESEGERAKLETQIVRLQEKIKQGGDADQDIRRQLEESEKERSRLETQLARTPMEGAVTRRDDAELERKVEQLEDDRTRLEARLKKIVAENRRMKSEVAGADGTNGSISAAEQRENAELRTQINHLAAEIVNLTALLDGPNSEISDIIRDGKGRADPIDRSASIADRVRALREAALSAHRTRA